MEESEQLKVTDLRIGDKVRRKRIGLEFTVIGICNNGTLYLEYGRGGVWKAELDEVELIEKGGEE